MPTLTEPAPAPPPPQAPRRTDPALRRLLTALVAIFAAGCVVTGALALVGHASRATETVRTTYPGVTTLQLDTGPGDVSIVQGGRGTPVRVTARITRSFRTPECAATARRAASCGWRATATSGWAVPAASTTTSPSRRARASSPTSGRAMCASRSADPSPIVVRGGSGDLDVRDVSAPEVELRVGSGNIEGDLRRSPLVTVETGSGDLALALREAPERLRASAGSGDVELTVPAGSYRILMRTLPAAT